MAPGGGREKKTPLPPKLAAFRDLVAACNKRPATENQQKFVKKMASIPTVALPTKEPCKAVLNLAE